MSPLRMRGARPGVAHLTDVARFPTPGLRWPRPQQKVRILCILSTLLGNKRMTERLLQVFRTMPDVEPVPVLLQPEDYRNFPAPRWAKLTNPWESQYIAWQKSQAYLAQPFDMLLVNSWENVIRFRDVARRVPAAALLDVVPATVDAQMRDCGHGGWKRRLSHTVHSAAFARAVPSFDCLLPMGSDCARSLVDDYGCDPGRCRVTLAPQDLDVWRPSRTAPSEPLRLLFVGNDFARKGGDFLLHLYSSHLASACRLVIASNDPSIANRNWPSGVTLVHGLTREQMLDLYRQSDLFLFPTRQDFMPQAVAEALAVGLPCIATDVGAVRDLVRTGETGFLMSRADTPELWARRIQELIVNPDELARLSEGARRFAEENLGLPRFAGLMGEIIQRLRLAGNQRVSVSHSGRQPAHPTRTNRSRTVPES